MYRILRAIASTHFFSSYLAGGSFRKKDDRRNGIIIEKTVVIPYKRSVQLH
jgi:hypothetical protein